MTETALLRDSFFQDLAAHLWLDTVALCLLS
jgi:hypothetical protein